MPIRIEKQNPFIEFSHVIRALLKREMHTRIGKYQLGALWLLLEPLTTVIMLGLILGPIIGRSSGEVPYAFFLLCGFTQLKSLTGLMTSGGAAINSNSGLLVFRQVEPIDPFISRFIFHLCSTLLSFGIFCLLGIWLGVQLSSAHLHIVLSCFLITWMIGSGLGLIIGILSTEFKELEKIMQFIQHPLLFLSCVIIPYRSLPEMAQNILYWNPLVHVVEYTRHSLFPIEYPVSDLNLLYPAIWAIISLALGLNIYRVKRHYLKQR